MQSLATRRLGPEFTEPDWELVDHFAGVYGVLKNSEKFSPEFLEAQAHLQENALAFIENCAWIMAHAHHQHVLLKLNAPQLILWDEFERARAEERAVLINLLKYRRWGASTEVALWFSLRSLIYPNSETVVIPRERGPGRKIIKMYETFFDFLFHGPYEDRKNRYARYQPEQGLGGRNSERLIFGDKIDGTKGLNCSIEMMLAKDAGGQRTGTIGRGGGAQNVHGTEVAFWPNFDATMDAIMPMVPDNPDSAVVLETTSGGPGTPHHTFWNECEAGDLPFVNIFIGWADDPNNRIPFQKPEDEEKFLKTLGDNDESRWGNEAVLVHDYHLDAGQLNWRRRTMQLHCKGNIETWNKEYPLTADMAFAQGGDHFISSQRMWVFLDNAVPPKLEGRFDSRGFGTPIFNAVAQRPLWRIWEEREEWSQYLVIADFSTNQLAKDHTAAIVLKLMEFRHVATFRGDDNYRPSQNESGDQIIAGARYYNNALVAPERNGLGESFIEYAMGTLGYHNIVSDVDIKPEAHAGPISDNVRYGVPTHRGNRQAMMEDLKFLYELSQDWEIYDELAIREVQELRPIKTPGNQVKIQAPKKGQPRRPNTSERGFYDDLAMCQAIGAWLVKRLPAPKTREQLREAARVREAARATAMSRARDGRVDYI
uniref:Putative terminase n=1 Tax=viral metagenome TaxID=1070528 RepID=A0A6M3IYK6_9ZZZZ